MSLLFSKGEQLSLEKPESLLGQGVRVQGIQQPPLGGSGLVLLLSVSCSHSFISDSLANLWCDWTAMSRAGWESGPCGTLRSLGSQTLAFLGLTERWQPENGDVTQQNAAALLFKALSWRM